MKFVTVQGTMQLAAPAAAAWASLVDDAREHTGVTLTISSPGGAYRDDALVLDMWRNPRKYGATKGTAKPRSLGGPGSVHENGLCVDIWNWAAIGTKRLDELAARHGFRRTIAAEPWHYQHSGATPAGSDATPFDERKRTMTTVYWDGQNPAGGQARWALGGDSPGTTANWIETGSKDLADKWAAVHGPIVDCGSRASFLEFRSWYQQPLRIVSSSTAPAGPTAAELVDELVARIKD